MSAEGGKSKKKGRNVKDCKAYFGNGSLHVNRAMRLYRYLRRGINTEQTLAALARIENSYKVRARKALRATGFKSAATDVEAA